MPAKSLRALLENSIDYAGLFPRRNSRSNRRCRRRARTPVPLIDGCWARLCSQSQSFPLRNRNLVCSIRPIPCADLRPRTETTDGSPTFKPRWRKAAEAIQVSRRRATGSFGGATRNAAAAGSDS